MNKLETSAKLNIELPEDDLMVIDRIIDAPRKLVYDAYTNPEAIPEWWGPRDLTTVIAEMELQEGGSWKYVQKDNEGNEFIFFGEYLEVVPYEKLSWTFNFESEKFSSENPIRETVEFLEVDEYRTKIKMRSTYNSKEERDAMIQSGMEHGLSQTLERLEEIILDTRDQKFSLTRLIDAPVEKVWKAWTDINHFKNWFGPKGSELTAFDFDLTPGGIFHYKTVHPEFGTSYGIFVYRDINEPNKLIYVNSFSNAEGEVVRAPFNDTWPLQLLNVLKLTENGGKTELTLSSSPLNGSAAEHATFQQSISSLDQGFSGTMEQLEEYLLKIKS